MRKQTIQCKSRTREHQLPHCATHIQFLSHFSSHDNVFVVTCLFESSGDKHRPDITCSHNSFWAFRATMPQQKSVSKLGLHQIFCRLLCCAHWLPSPQLPLGLDWRAYSGSSLSKIFTDCLRFLIASINGQPVAEISELQCTRVRKKLRMSPLETQWAALY